MKTLLYIGNKLSKSGKTETTIETLGKKLSSEGYSVVTSSNKKNKVLRLFDMLMAILKYAKKVDYVLIDTYSTSNFYYAYLCSQLCRFLKLKYIPILHGGNLPNRLKLSPKLCHSIFTNAYLNVAPSVYIQSEFKKYGYSNLIHIPNTINLQNYSFKERNFETIKLLWVRSFSEIYNPFLAVEILKSLLDEGIQASLCMVGPDNDGSLQKTKAYAKTLQVEVIFTGKLSKPEWIALSKDFNIFINTTHFDNMPVSVIEAMALGLPVISTNVGGMPFLIDNDNDGILVKPNTATEFVSAIKTIRSNPKKMNQMTFNARKKAESYNWDVVKNLWISVLK
ncbi:glycosyltransferase involved in cell wall biosynthesis [Mariniflexile fucanivorans]|uniref:Glycosyltransferase involved in cell wall biosynthesis n=1 Tax=Mariniflexile fucanivorans TaxID=264023 RepID=A0A4R1RDH2_9FLAO|nr:glycosyltransferase family 4 protein [Mariniflexile fucanivorans]TCL63901.1 glycosyltransferase involved in cell wall biosynthesis [Mariniflexile fucanivorans]